MLYLRYLSTGISSRAIKGKPIILLWQELRPGKCRLYHSTAFTSCFHLVLLICSKTKIIQLTVLFYCFKSVLLSSIAALQFHAFCNSFMNTGYNLCVCVCVCVRACVRACFLFGSGANNNNNKNNNKSQLCNTNRSMRGVRKEMNYSEPCWNAPDKAQCSLVLKWVRAKLYCALSWAFEHGSE